jgi:membrane-bound ClpP family serine protease
MQFLLNPNVGYLLTVAAVVLFLLSVLVSKSKITIIGLILCLVAAGYVLIRLRANPWALLVVGLSPLPYVAAVRRPRPIPGLLATVAMFGLGSAFLFVDQYGRPAINMAGIVSVLMGEVLWIAISRKQNEPGRRLSDDPESVVGLLGKARTEIENHTAGLVEVGGELCMARSQEPIAAGSTVRILRRDGFVLTVRKEDRLGKE